MKAGMGSVAGEEMCIGDRRRWPHGEWRRAEG